MKASGSFDSLKKISYSLFPIHQLTFFSSARDDYVQNVSAWARGAGDESLHDERKPISAARERRS